MKNRLKIGVAAFLAAVMVLFLIGCEQDALGIVGPEEGTQVPVAFTEQPAVSTAVTAGGTIEPLTVVVTGTPSPTVTWYKSEDGRSQGGTEVGKGNSYSPPVNQEGVFWYYAVAASGSTTKTSNIATVTVNPASGPVYPTITEQPVAPTSRNPDMSVKAAADDGGELSYQWYSNTRNSNQGGTAIGGATSDSYTPPPKDIRTYYYVVITNTKDGETSEIPSVVVQVNASGGGGGDDDGFGERDQEFVAKYPYFVVSTLGPKEILTEETLPAVSYWNETGEVSGHKHAYPDPFHFANGNRVVTIKDWENRRKEMKLMMTWYQKGRVPSVAQDVIKIELGGNTRTNFQITHIASGRTQTGSSTVTANESVQTADNYGKLGYGNAVDASGMALGGTYISIARGNIQTLYGIPANTVTRDSAAAWNASVILTAIEGVDDSGEMQYFYPTPAYDAETGEGDPEGPRSWFTTKGALAATGVSTGGKLSQATAVFAEGRQGSRFGFTHIGDSGAVGAAIERFISVAGFRLDISAQEALAHSGFTAAEINAIGLPPDFKNTQTGNTPRPTSVKNYGWPVDAAPLYEIGAITQTTSGSLGGWQDLWGYPYYLVPIANDDQMIGYGVGGISHTYKGTSADRMVGARGRAGRGWSPYFEKFYQAPSSGNSQAISAGNYLTGTNGASRVPFVAMWDPQQQWSGIQNLMQARGENRTNRDWQNVTFDDFTDLHNGLDLDFARNQGGGRGVEGFCCTMPHDTYFANFLLAPYGSQFIAAGSAQMRTNQPSQQANWMLTDEIYKFYGEQEEYERTGQWVEDPEYPGSGLYKGWDTYIWLNLQDLHWGGHEGGSGGTMTTYGEQRARYLKEEDYGTDVARTNLPLAQLRTPFFPVDDPVTYLGDFHKMDWGRPKGGYKALPDSFAGAMDSQNPTIATRVQRRVYPILKDYFMGEVYHAVPVSTNNAAGAAAIANNYHPEEATFTPTGPRFKPMDWRGLIDTPEEE